MPDDLSGLYNVNNLNLQNIVFADFEASIGRLATLPALRSLYISLQTEDQVDLIMSALPNLEYLNGLAVDRDALQEDCLLYTSPSPRDLSTSRMPSSA